MERVDRDDSAGDATLGAGSGADIGVGRFVLTDPDIDIDLDEDVDCMEVDPLMGGGGKVCSLMQRIHAIWFIRNTVEFQLVLFLKFSQN